MTKSLLSEALAMAVAMAAADGLNNPLNHKPDRGAHKLDAPDNVVPVIPKGCRVWPEYGGVVAMNEKNAERKYLKLLKNHKL